MSRPAPLGLGIVGLGTAGAAMLGAALRVDGVQVVAVADPLVAELPLCGLGSTAVYASLEALLEDPAVEAVHLATPTPLHGDHVRLALAAGRHVVVEKPVTAHSDEGRALAALAATSGHAVIVGHSESFEPYAAAAGAAIAEGRIGTVVAVMAEKVTDWMRRPRRPDELDPCLGGGIVRRQGVHQVDVVRSLVPDAEFRLARSRLVIDGRLGRPAGYVAWLESAAATACLVQDGRGVCAPAVEPPASGPQVPSEEKRRRAAHLVERAVATGRPLALGGSDLEQVSVLGTEGRLVCSSRHVAVERGGDVEEIDLGSLPDGRTAVLDELRGAIGGTPARHGLSWGAENLRLCEAIEQGGER